MSRIDFLIRNDLCLGSAETAFYVASYIKWSCRGVGVACSGGVGGGGGGGHDVALTAPLIRAFRARRPSWAFSISLMTSAASASLNGGTGISLVQRSSIMQIAVLNFSIRFAAFFF